MNKYKGIFSLFFCKTKRGCRKKNRSTSGKNDVGTEDDVEKMMSENQELEERDEKRDSGFSQDNPLKSGARENKNKRTMNTTV